MNVVVKLSRYGLVILALAVSFSRPASAIEFDFDTGNSAVEVIIPTAAPAIFQFVSPAAGDATLVLRITTLINNGWFDATAPYHPTAVGVYTRLGRRPVNESVTNVNINTAMFYSSLRILTSLLPEQWPSLS